MKPTSCIIRSVVPSYSTYFIRTLLEVQKYSSTSIPTTTVLVVNEQQCWMRPELRRKSGQMAISRRNVLYILLFVLFILFTATLALEFGMLPQTRESLPRASSALMINSPGATLVSRAAARMRALTEAARRLPSRPPELAQSLAENISVIMPCFGHSAFLEEALTSVVNQHYPPVEIIVIDDASSDRCGELVTPQILYVALILQPKRRIYS